MVSVTLKKGIHPKIDGSANLCCELLNRDCFKSRRADYPYIKKTVGPFGEVRFASARFGDPSNGSLKIR
jgi:hypothetical protein